MAKVRNRNMDRTGWQERDDLNGNENFNPATNQAVYVLSWSSASDSWAWESKLSRSSPEKLVNNDSIELLIEDNCAIFIETSTLDKTNITYCNAELYLATYNSSNSQLNKWKLDRDYVDKINTGTQDLWNNKNLTLQGIKKYTLSPGDYAKVWVEINYDGDSPSILLEGWHEQTELKY